MKTIPQEFRDFLMRAVISHPVITATRLRHMMILRWMLWQEGNKQNALPGYAWCPVDCGKGYPHGWTLKNFQTIWRQSGELMRQELIGRKAVRHLSLPH